MLRGGFNLELKKKSISFCYIFNNFDKFYEEIEELMYGSGFADYTQIFFYWTFHHVKL